MSTTLEQNLDEIKRQKDLYLKSDNIKKNVTILGVTGDYETVPTLQSKMVTPSDETQTVEADDGYDGLSSVQVNGDSDLTASNIKKNVNIFGVTGTLPTEDDILNAYFDRTLTNSKYKYSDIAKKNPPLTTSSLTTMQDMFAESDLQEIDTTGFSTSSVTNMSGLCADCINLTSFNKVGLDTSSVTNMSKMFTNCSSLTTIDLSNINTANLSSTVSMFEGCSSLEMINLRNWNTNSITDMSYMFSGCENLSTLNLAGFDFTNVVSYTDIFKDVPYDCGIIVSSQEAKDWILARRSDFTNITVVEDILVAITGSSSYDISYSTNGGSSWTTAYTGSREIRGVIYAGGKFIAFSGSQNALYSFDGKTWTDCGSNLSYCTTLAYGNGYYVGLFNNYYIAKSQDGIIWTRTRINFTKAYFNSSMTFYNGRFIATGTSGLAYSDDYGDTWTEITTGMPSYTTVLNNKLFGIVNNKICVSQDGTSWTPTDSTTVGGYGIISGNAYGNGIYIICTSNSGYAVSIDGTNWSYYTRQQPNSRILLQFLLYGFCIFYILGCIYYYYLENTGWIYLDKRNR